jgi:hypothetical protein
MNDLLWMSKKTGTLPVARAAQKMTAKGDNDD